MTGHYDEAIKLLEPISSQNAEANYLIALSYFNLKKYKESMPYFSSYVKTNPDNVPALLQKAEAEKKLGDYKEALIDLKKIIELKPGYYPACLSMGEVYYAEKKYNDAINHFNKTIELKPDLEKAYYRLGFCYLVLKDTVKACMAWKNLKDPDDFEDYEIIEKTCKP